jgi:hypothetical protein
MVLDIDDSALLSNAYYPSDLVAFYRSGERPPIADVDTELAALYERGMQKFPAKQPAAEYWDDKELGTFCKDNLSDIYRGRIPWQGHDIELIFFDAEAATIKAELSTAKLILKDATTWDKEIKAYAAQQIHKKKDKWPVADDKPLTEAQLSAKLCITALEVDQSGRYAVQLTTGDIFEGQAIVVEANTRSGFKRAYLH